MKGINDTETRFPLELARYWGKAKPPQGTSGPAYHPLVYHCLDVAAVAKLWLEADAPLRHTLARQTRDREERAVAWVLFFVALHDLGKWDHRFQLKAPEVARALRPALATVDTKWLGKVDHGLHGLMWFKLERSDYGLEAEPATAWMTAVASHHGAEPRVHGADKPRNKQLAEEDRAARRVWVGVLRDLFLEPAGIRPGDLPPQAPQLLAGFCCACDWLGSNPEFFEYREPTLNPRCYFEERYGDDRSNDALTYAGFWRPAHGTGGMAALFDETPRGVQTLVDRLPVEPGLTIVEAPTGSGKTEFALALASRLLAARLADSIVFALPTQATANAMLTRVEKVAPRIFPEADAINVVLAHGKARLNEAFQRLTRAALDRTAQGPDDAYSQCSRWLAESRKRVFLGQIGVCTIDQVLLSVLPIRHNFVRSFGVQRSVLIIDEVHAYDSYMNGLLDEVLARQRDAGGSAILLSATLPSQRREALVRLWSGREPVESREYPLVTTVGASETMAFVPEDRPTPREVTFELDLTADMLPSDGTLDRICRAAEAGAKVAIVCNLVSAAQQLKRLLASRTAVPVDLFHSRFRFRDRDRVERAAVAAYGRERVAGGRILVATQVIEQSLDVDFDLVVTQLCPVELLFQRIGRLWRHEWRALAERAGAREPRCIVVAPTGPFYGLHAIIYPNVLSLWRTQRKLDLQRERPVGFPAAYREWIEVVFDDDGWDGEPADLVDKHRDYTSEEVARRYKALQLARSARTAEPFADTDGNASGLTRDSEMSVSVVPVLAGRDERTLLDGEVLDRLDVWAHARALDKEAIPVPHRWCHALPKRDPERGVVFLEMTPDAGGWTATCGGKTITYTESLGLERSDP